MQAFLNWLSAFLASYGPWIVTGLIPTVITGLSLSPKTSGAVTWVQKAAEVFKQIMSILSFVTHKDEPGTFQVPVLKAFKKKGGPGPGAGAAGCAALFLLAASMTQTGCAGLWKDTAPVRNKVFDCVKSVAKENAVRLLPAVIAIFEGNADNWRDQLGAFGKQFGEEALACAVNAATEEIHEKVMAGVAADAHADSSALTKARTFAAEKKWSFTSPE